MTKSKGSLAPDSERSLPADGDCNRCKAVVRFQTAVATIRAVVDARRQQPGALLPILHDIQDQLGHVQAAAVSQVAEALQRHRAQPA